MKKKHPSKKSSARKVRLKIVKKTSGKAPRRLTAKKSAKPMLKLIAKAASLHRTSVFRAKI